jgi:hypothetical protein
MDESDVMIQSVKRLSVAVVMIASRFAVDVLPPVGDFPVLRPRITKDECIILLLCIQLHEILSAYIVYVECNVSLIVVEILVIMPYDLKGVKCYINCRDYPEGNGYQQHFSDEPFYFLIIHYHLELEIDE